MWIITKKENGFPFCVLDLFLVSERTKRSPIHHRLSPEMRLDYLWFEPETVTRESHRKLDHAVAVNVLNSIHAQ